MTVNELGISKEYLELELPSSMEDYQIWESYKERKILFNDDVDASGINKIVYYIRKWNEEDERNNVPVEERVSPQLITTTNGGDVVAGLAIVDAIKASKTPITGVAIGCVASMGVPIYTSCHRRLSYPNTVFLIHDGSMGAQGTSNKVKSTLKFYDRLDARVKKIIIDNTKISTDLYEEKEDEEWYMFADEEGIELGIVDEIIA